MMKTKKKALLMSLCAMMLVGVSIFGTLAYLADTTNTVTNTFTVGNVDIKLDEAVVDEKGEANDHDNDRTEVGNEYHLMPGHTYDKDPTVTVLEGSEESYVRMIVKVEGMDDLKAALSEYVVNDVFLLQELCEDAEGNCTWDSTTWKYAGFDPTTNEYEFRYFETVDATEDDVVLKDLFTKITVPGTVDNAELAKLANVKIIVTADAIQAEGFVADETRDMTAEDVAWEAFDNQNVTPAPTETPSVSPSPEEQPAG